jgi:CRISPR-associated endonuclease/helicase Cas3
VFEAADHATPPEIAAFARDLERILPRHADLLAPAAIADYFAEVYWRKDADLDRHRVAEAFLISAGRTSFLYRSVAEAFRLTESGMLPVIVPRDDCAYQAIELLRAGRISPAVAARRLLAFLVQVPPHSHRLLWRTATSSSWKGSASSSQSCGRARFTRPSSACSGKAAYLGLEQAII